MSTADKAAARTAERLACSQDISLAAVDKLTWQCYKLGHKPVIVPERTWKVRKLKHMLPGIVEQAVCLLL